VPRFVGPKLGTVAAVEGDEIDVEVTLEAAPSVVWDAMVIPDGEAWATLAAIGQAVEFVKDQYRHCKPILALGAGERLLEAANVPQTLPDDSPDPGVLVLEPGDEAADAFTAAVARHRHFERYSDPPRV
jgi:catalase